MVNYSEDREYLKQQFNNSSDILFLDFQVADRACVMVYADGLSDKELMDRNIIEPLKKARAIKGNVLEFLNSVIFIADPIFVLENLDEAVAKIADGDIAFIIEGAEKPLAFTLKNYKTRAITEPPVSTVLRGPREGFVEDMKTNMTMVRRRMRSPNLVFKNMKIGKYTETNIAVCWLEGIASGELVGKVIDKLSNINIDGIIDSSYLSRFLETRKNTIFTSVGTCEKPDILTGKMLEGRIGIIVDGSPSVLTLPFIAFEHLQSSEDYYIKSTRATFVRIIRVLSLIIGVLLPGAYVALQEFQYQMLPLRMLTAIMNTIAGIPLTPVLEMLLLILLFEILNETSIRMPRYVGTALSIVGAIILGEAAITAGLLSTPALLVTAVSTIGLYAVPDEMDSTSLLRVLFVLISGVLGLFGLLMGVVATLAYLVSMNSYGSSYLAPYAPLYMADMQDSILMENLVDRHVRPHSIPTSNRTRLKDKSSSSK